LWEALTTSQSPTAAAWPDGPVAPRRWRPFLAALLIVPVAATVAVALFRRASPRPVAYCRAADQFFGQLQLSGDAGRAGKDDPAASALLFNDSAKAHAAAPLGLAGPWAQVGDAVARLRDTGAAAGVDQTQDQIDAAIGKVHDDYQTRCRDVVPAATIRPLDGAGLVGLAPPAAYCQRTQTFLTDLGAASHTPDQPTRDRLVSEANTVVTTAPSALAADWAYTVAALVRLQKTGSSTDAGHTQQAVASTVNRLAGDFASRCPSLAPGAVP
jgi:hypothetical protein